ncbi:MAG: hypothetical protein ACYCZR_09305, partial [Burkholderiales bacterium]
LEMARDSIFMDDPKRPYVEVRGAPPIGGASLSKRRLGYLPALHACAVDATRLDTYGTWTAVSIE